MENVPIKSIIDVSWRFGVTVASSGPDEVGKNFMQLHIKYDEEGKKKSLFTEMDLAQFYKFINDLEKAKSN